MPDQSLYTVDAADRHLLWSWRECGAPQRGSAQMCKPFLCALWSAFPWHVVCFLSPGQKGYRSSCCKPQHRMSVVACNFICFAFSFLDVCCNCLCCFFFTSLTSLNDKGEVVEAVFGARWCCSAGRTMFWGCFWAALDLWWVLETSLQCRPPWP